MIISKDITERFANRQQTLQDALANAKRRVQGDAENIQEVWQERFLHDSKLARVLSSDNNSKAALNFELIKWLHQNSVFSNGCQ